MSENKDKTFSMADMVDDSERVDADALMAQFDIESNTRHYLGLPRKLVRYMLAAFTLFVLYMSIFPTWSEYIRRGAFVSLIVFMAFMMYPASRKNNVKVNYVPWYDFVLAIVGAGCFFYIVANNASILVRASRLLPYEVAIGIVGILILAEVCRRCVGVPILVVVGAFVAYAFFAGYSINRVIYQLFYTLDGVMGTPIGVCTTFIALFIILAAFLEKTNIGSFFIDIANSVAGWASGGPAKVAVITSAFEGMYSGSSVANTVGSGSITIPVMKKTGYAPEFSAAVEAAASTGGQIMPPIMGAAAFLMAEMTELPYSTIVVAAILPAILYFTGIFIMIHYEAKKLGLKGISRDQIPNFFKLFFTKGYLLLPIVVLVLCMNRMSASMSASWAILTAIVVSMFRKDTRMTPTTFVDALESGAKNTISVTVACGIAGMIVGIITLSGLGLKMGSLLISLSGGIPIIALFLTMIACIILGMGVPTTANYVIMATICAPMLVPILMEAHAGAFSEQMTRLATHMFVFYFGIVADITPPVALAATAGAAIAKAHPIKTGVTATRLAITAFIIPYIFALNPSLLLLEAQWYNVLQIVCTSVIGMIGIASGMEGFLKCRMPWWQRILAIGGGLLLIEPTLVTDIVGIALVGIVVLIQFASAKRHKASPGAAVS
jgi:TRAP transporter 4TM/12TM fusion protein